MFSGIKKTQIRVLLIGLGNVGIVYDNGSPSTILTHARGIHSAARFHGIKVELFGVDPNEHKRKVLTDTFPYSSAFKSLEELQGQQFDLVIFACSTDELIESFLNAQKYFHFNKAVIEKPVSRNLMQFDYLEKFRNSHIDLRVGFPRRTLPSSLFLKDLVNQVNQADTWTVDLQVGGDMLNIGSHFLDLIYFLFGEFEISEYYKKNNFVKMKAHSVNLNLSISQNSEKNNEQTSFEALGPINFSYQMAGRKIDLFHIDIRESWSFDTFFEIEGMIGFEAIDYVGWVVNNSESKLPKLLNNPLRCLLQRMDS